MLLSIVVNLLSTVNGTQSAPQAASPLVHHGDQLYWFQLVAFRWQAIASSLYDRWTRSSAIVEGRRDASCQLKSCQLLSRNSAETTYTISFDQIDGMKLEV